MAGAFFDLAEPALSHFVSVDPCGGSFDGICERQDRNCFWTKVINRLDRDGELEKMKDREPIYRNAALEDTSSWINFYLGRDHAKTGSEKKPENKE